MISLLKKTLEIFQRYGFKETLRQVWAFFSYHLSITVFKSFRGHSLRTWKKKNQVIRQTEKQEILEKVYTLIDPLFFSVVVPVYNTDPVHLKECIESVHKQLYPNWELILVNDASTDPRVGEILDFYSKFDSRIQILTRKENGNICKATNDGIEKSKYDWIVFLDHDDTLDETALFWFQEEIKNYPESVLVYSDEERMNEKGKAYEAFFKPDFSPERLRRQNYINHLTAIRKIEIEKVGGLRVGMEGSQDHDLVLRVLSPFFKLSRFEQELYVRHIPRILYSWRIVQNTKQSFSQKNFQKAREIAQKAIQDHLQGLNIPAKVELLEKNFFRIEYSLLKRPIVSILIPTRDRVDLLKVCIDSILERTQGVDFEIVIIDNDSTDKLTFQYFAEVTKNPKIRVLQVMGEFNYSKLNNEAAKEAKGGFLCLLNNDIKVESPNWLEKLCSLANLDYVGAVGPILLYPNDKIQHAGIVLGTRAWAGHSFRNFFRHENGDVASSLQLTREVSAVTGACLLVKKELYERVGGLDEENLKVGCNDVDFCLKLLNLGYRNLITPDVYLYHYESASRGLEAGPKRERFEKEVAHTVGKWKDYFENDPYYNPHLTRKYEDHGYRLEKETN